jgi:UDP-glucose 4-epimerase
MKRKKRILLVGGNGFIGSHLIDELMKEGNSVRVLDRRTELFRKPITGVEYIIGSFADLFTLREAIEGCDILIHLAHSTVPLTSLNHPEEEVLDSVGAFVNMINCFKNKGIQKIVLFSSGGAVYGNPEALPVREDDKTNPISPYGVAKLMMEKYLQMFNYLYGLKYIIVRPSNPFGPRQNYMGQQGAIPIFMKKILDDEPIQLWGGSSIKDYLYVTDLVKAVVMLMEKGFNNSVYNISSGLGVNLRELTALIGAICGQKPRVEVVAERRYDVKETILSYEKLRLRTGWQPIKCLKDGLKQTYQWIKLIECQHKG